MPVLLIVAACTHTTGRATAQSNPPQPVPIPKAMVECEVLDCSISGTWTFSGNKGLSLWNNGRAANLTIERFDADAVVIRRVEIPTRASGPPITGTYNGTISSNQISGMLTRIGLGMKQPKSQPWSAQIGTLEEQQELVQQQGQTVEERQNAEDRASIEFMLGFIGAVTSSKANCTNAPGVQRNTPCRN